MLGPLDRDHVRPQSGAVLSPRALPSPLHRHLTPGYESVRGVPGVLDPTVRDPSALATICGYDLEPSQVRGAQPGFGLHYRTSGPGLNVGPCEAHSVDGCGLVQNLLRK